MCALYTRKTAQFSQILPFQVEKNAIYNTHKKALHNGKNSQCEIPFHFHYLLHNRNDNFPFVGSMQLKKCVMPFLVGNCMNECTNFSTEQFTDLSSFTAWNKA